MCNIGKNVAPRQPGEKDPNSAKNCPEHYIHLVNSTKLRVLKAQAAENIPVSEAQQQPGAGTTTGEKSSSNKGRLAKH
jgi:hypothetical protein